MSDILADLQAAADRKWRGDPACQQAGLFARAAAEIEQLRAERNTVDAAVSAERERWAAVCDANASAKRALYATTESDDDRGAAEMAEWLARCIRGA